MNLDDLIEQAHPLLLNQEAPVGAIRLESGAPAELAVGALIEYFGTYADRAAIRLVVDDRDLGYLEREDAYRYVPAGNKGHGASGYSGLPGLPIGGARPVAQAWTELWCPVEGCPENPVYAAVYDEAETIECRVHAGKRLEARR